MRIVSTPVSGAMPDITERTDGWDRSLDAALVAPDHALLDRLHTPGVLVVTTGQQPGLFGGPLYTVHKAIAAAALAAELSTRWNRPVVPVFWMAGDDHDHAEASTAAWRGADHALQRFALPSRAPTAVQHPMFREPLGAGVNDAIAAIERSLPGVDIDWIRRWWHADATVHGAFAGAMAELLAPLGIACLDPTTLAFKAAQLPLLRTALERSDAIDAAVAAAGDVGTGITAGDGATTVFVESAAGRDRLIRDGDRFRARRSGEEFSQAALERLMTADPTRFSANVLLRPVVEAALLPTVAYVAGPGELRYLDRQAALIYPLLDVSPQAAVPRWGGEVVERWVDRLLSRLDLTFDDIVGDDGSLARTILRRDLPEAVAPALADARDAIARNGTVLHAAGQAIDPVLDRAVTGRLRRVEQMVDDLERILERHLRRRTDIAHAQFERIRDALRPGGTPQERVLSVGPVLAVHDGAWLDAARASANTWAETQLAPSSDAG